jgi:hypothetical protein
MERIENRASQISKMSLSQKYLIDIPSVCVQETIKMNNSSNLANKQTCSFIAFLLFRKK